MVTSASNKVKVALGNNPTGAKLGGTLSVTASKGVATFSGLTINKVGSGYTLQLTSSGLTSATHEPDHRDRRQRTRSLGRDRRRPTPSWHRWCSTARISSIRLGIKKRTRFA